MYPHIPALTFNPIFFNYPAENLTALIERGEDQSRYNTEKAIEEKRHG